MILLGGKALSLKTKEEPKNMSLTLKTKGVEPCLAVILVGDNAASQSYVDAKTKACEACEIKSLVYKLDFNTIQNELLVPINTLNYGDSVHGTLVQPPLLPHINKNLALESISSSKDVDGFHPINAGYLSLGIESGFLPCTSLGVMKLLKAYEIDLEGLDTVVIGASSIVGRPMATMLLNVGAGASICHIKTKDLSSYTKKADLIIVAAGCVNLLKEDMVKEGVIVVGVRINRIDNRLAGDVDFDKVSKKASFISPVSGGVGPMTIAILFENTIKSAKNRSLNPQIQRSL